jgi:hypothetical protein
MHELYIYVVPSKQGKDKFALLVDPYTIDQLELCALSSFVKGFSFTRSDLEKAKRGEENLEKYAGAVFAGFIELAYRLGHNIKFVEGLEEAAQKSMSTNAYYYGTFDYTDMRMGPPKFRRQRPAP